MGKQRVNIGDRLAALGHDPVEAMVRVAKAAEDSGNLPLAAKVNSDLMEYTAPKLKSIEVSLDPDTLDGLLTPEQRRARIRELANQVGLPVAAPTQPSQE